MGTRSPWFGGDGAVIRPHAVNEPRPMRRERPPVAKSKREPTGTPLALAGPLLVRQVTVATDPVYLPRPPAKVVRVCV